MKSKKPENPWLSLLFNLVIPTLILTKGSDYLGAGPAFAAALSVNLGYALFDFSQRRQFSWIAGLGIASVLCKGGLGLLKLDLFWFAVNEAAIPTLLALAFLIGQLRGKPLVKEFLLNESVVNTELIYKRINDSHQQEPFARAINLASVYLIVAFLISAVLNFVLAIWILKSPVGTTEFNAEMGTMNAISMPVILLCSSSLTVFALWKLLREIERLTGLKLEEILETHRK